MPASVKIASPLNTEAPAYAEGPGLKMRERRDTGMLLIRGKRANPAFARYFEAQVGITLPEDRHAVPSGDFSVVRMGPADYLVSGDIDAVAALSRRAEDAAEGVPCVAAEITHGRIIIDLEGPEATTVLSKCCGLDTRLTAFPVGLGSRTRFADVLAYVERRGETAFRLVSDRATGEFFWNCLKDAGAEFLN